MIDLEKTPDDRNEGEPSPLPSSLLLPVLHRAATLTLTQTLGPSSASIRSLLLTGGRPASEALAALAPFAAANPASILAAGSVLDDDLILSLASSRSIAVRTRLLDLLLVCLRRTEEGFRVWKEDFALALFLGLSRDLYPLVRRRAVDGLAAVCSARNAVAPGGVGRMVEVYDRAVGTLLDEDAEVRRAGIRLMSEWGRMLAVNRAEGIDVDGMSDAVFVQLCSMARDMDVKVRVEAFVAFERVKVVSESMLLQSLSKKVLRPSVGGNEIAENTMQLIRESKFSLSSAAGAFIHGLEDDFYEVREAACTSLGMLSVLSMKFADGALTLLMDMLNDDKITIQLRTLQIFLDMARYDRLKLQEVHSHMFFSMLVDINSSIRHASRKVVCVVTLLDMKMFRSAVNILLVSLEKYPEDEEDIFFDLFHVGKNHGKFATRFMEESIHEIETSCKGELYLDRPRVAAFLVIAIAIHFSCGKTTCHIPQRVFSYAISFLGRISSSLRSIIRREHLLTFLCHKSGMPFSMKLGLNEKEKLSNPVDENWNLHVLHGKMPETFVSEEMLVTRQGPTSVRQFQQIEMVNENAKLSIIKPILKTIAETWPMIRLQCSCEVTLRTCKNQLETITEDVNSYASASVAFIKQYIQVIEFIAESWVYFFPGKARVLGARKLDILVAKLDHALREMRYTFLGYSKEEEAHILELTLLCCLAKLHGTGICPRPLLTRIRLTFSCMEDPLQGDSSNISDFVRELKNATQAGTSEQHFQLPVSNLLRLFTLREIQFIGRLRHIKADLLVPGNDSENPLPFVPWLPVGIQMKITLYNIMKGNRVWLQMMVGELIQHVYLDFNQFEGTDEMRSCMINVPFHRAPGAVMFILKATVTMELPSQGVTKLRKCKGGPRFETITISDSRDIYLVNTDYR